MNVAPNSAQHSDSSLHAEAKVAPAAGGRDELAITQAMSTASTSFHVRETALAASRMYRSHGHGEIDLSGVRVLDPDTSSVYRSSDA